GRGEPLSEGKFHTLRLTQPDGYRFRTVLFPDLAQFGCDAVQGFIPGYTLPFALAPGPDPLYRVGQPVPVRKHLGYDEPPLFYGALFARQPALHIGLYV